MQFKHPEILYALFLLLIPILVHLFQLRRFKKVAFTNVAFLKEVTLQTRKSSQLKKWLTLITRLLLLACIILAFAQPFTSKVDVFNKTKETVIYLDNSFSMQARGNQGELLKRAVNDLINNLPEDFTFTLLTNDASYRNTTTKAIKNELLRLDYASNQLSESAALLKAKSFFSKDPSSLKRIVFISDFQQQKDALDFKNDSTYTLNFVKLSPVNTSNIAIDSAYISKLSSANIELTVNLKGSSSASVPVSLYNNNELIAKTSVDLSQTLETTFSLPTNTSVNGEIKIEDTNLQFDNSLFFTINNGKKIKVLSINETENDFLKRIYTNAEFEYSHTTPQQLNFNNIEEQNLIVINELQQISPPLNQALTAFTNNGGHVLIIPSENGNLQSYNNFLLKLGANFSTISSIEKRVTNINYSHPIYVNDVFEKRVSNFQFPKVNSFYNLNSSSTSSILNFEDGKPFLVQNQDVFIFTSALNSNNSNFKNSPLIVPTLYNIAQQSLKLPKLYYTIGTENTFDINIALQRDKVLSISNASTNFIPQQQYFNNKVAITTTEDPKISGTYNILNDNDIAKKVSYNYSNDESTLVYHDLSKTNLNVSNSITELFDEIKSDTKINALWKWFVIFALAFLIIEMLILKYFK